MNRGSKERGALEEFQGRKACAQTWGGNYWAPLVTRPRGEVAGAGSWSRHARMGEKKNTMIVHQEGLRFAEGGIEKNLEGRRIKGYSRGSKGIPKSGKTRRVRFLPFLRQKKHTHQTARIGPGKR